MPFSESLAARVRDVLARTRGVVEKRMFGGVGFLLHGNMLVGVWKEALVVRVGPAGYDEALLEPHVREFDVTGRPMTGWVLVDPEGIEDDEPLRHWVRRAAEFVDTLPAK
ncbi:MAG TPA: TfoX/Sxy family protein [Gemmataceae bacterium]|jgi:TfoX/Sxy family transcriptional regulator of competence genes|nr:TfoX/Sxy family protein [Gemmataceae bacterium]